MDTKKDYSLKAEQIARFAKALAHPARIQILLFLARQQECYFGDIHDEPAYRQSHRQPASKGTQGCRSHSRHYRGTQGEVLHQPRQLGVCT